MKNLNIFDNYKGVPCNKYEFTSKLVERIQSGEEKGISLEEHAQKFSTQVSIEGIVKSVRATYCDI